MKVRNVLFLLGSLALLPTLTLAETKADAITFTVDGGYVFFSPKRDIHNTATLGGALAYSFTEQWAMQFATNLLDTNSGDPSKHHVHGWVYLLDALYHFHDFHKLEPYAMAGVNIVSLKPISSEPVNQGGMNVGVGTQFFKSNHIALMAEARDIYTFSGGKNDVILQGGINFIWE